MAAYELVLGKVCSGEGFEGEKVNREKKGIEVRTREQQFQQGE
jgi:hypothetical protein